MHHLKTRSLIAGAVLAGLAGLSQAAPINVDIDGRRNDPGQDIAPLTYTGTGPVGGTFVGVTADSDPEFDGSNNDSQTFTYTNIGGTGLNFSVGTVGGDNNAEATDASSASALFGEYVFATDAGDGFTISGLTPNSTANVYLYSDGRFGALTLAGDSADAFVPTGVYTNDNTRFFSNVAVSGTGTIAGTSTGGLFVLTGFTVNEVPEPTTVSLLGLAGLGLLARRRKGSA